VRAMIVFWFVVVFARSVGWATPTEPLHGTETAHAQSKITASEVTFPRADLTLRQAIAILNQTGNPVVDYRSRQGQEVTDPVLKLPIMPLLFWPAVDEVAKQANLRVIPFWEKGKSVVGLLARPEGSAAPAFPVQYEGPFRITLVRVAAVHSVTEEIEPSRLLVTMQVAWEPRYRPLWLNIPGDGVQLTNAAGQTQPVPQLKPQSFQTADEASVTLTVQLPLPSRMQQSLPELRLRTIVVTPPRQTPFVFSTVSEGQQVRADGVTCTLARIERENPRRTWITVRLNYPPNTLDLESHQGWVMQANTLTLTPKNGGPPHPPTTTQAEINIREQAGIELRHPVDGLSQPLSAYELRYEAPAPPVKHPLEIRLRNVPLP
jgi:hypothetical protein